MTVGRCAVIVALACGASALLPRRAHACGPCLRESTVYSRTMIPAPAQVRVPLNTAVWVRYQFTTFGRPVMGQVTLRPVDGPPVEVELSTVPSADLFDRCRSAEFTVLRPRAPLQPNTSYEVLDQPHDMGCDGGCPPRAPVLVGRFVTGTAEDHEPPVFAGIKRWVQGDLEECDSSSCCGPYRARRFRVEADPVMDAGGLAGYEVSVDGKVIDLLPAPALDGFVFCSFEPAKGPSGAPRPAGRYHLTAVDLAGNRDANTVEIDVQPQCGPGAAADAGIDGDPPAPPATGDGGCALGGATPIALLPLALLLLRAGVSAAASGRRRGRASSRPR